MLKKVLLLILAMSLMATCFVFADEGEITLPKATEPANQEIRSIYEDRIGQGRAFAASIVAKLTNTSTEDILAANKAGMSFAEIAIEKGVALYDYKSAMLEGKTAYIDEQVDAGVLTKEQAKLIKERMQQRLEGCDGTTQNRQQLQGFGRKGMNGHRRGLGLNMTGLNN